MNDKLSQLPKYAYVIERADDGAYWAYFPDLPGCTTTADAPNGRRQLPEAVELYLSYFRAALRCRFQTLWELCPPRDSSYLIKVPAGFCIYFKLPHVLFSGSESCC